MFKRNPKSRRIGIYSGTFDPVHAGHIAFALQTIKAAKLDAIYFLPERRPRHKQGVEHLGHRIAMLQAAVRPHPALHVLETDDVSFTIHRTLPRLRQRFPSAELVFLFGSDVAQHIHTWPQAENLLSQAEVVIGLREGVAATDLANVITGWPTAARKPLLLHSHAPDVSSHKIREALAARTHTRGLLRSVVSYSNRNWLYVSLSKIAVDKA